MVDTPGPGLSPSADHFYHIFEQTPFPIGLLDDQGRLVYANATYNKVFLGIDAVLGAPARVLPEAFPDGRSQRQLLESVWTDGLARVEANLPVAGGRGVCFRLSLFPLRRAEEDTLKVAVVFEDIQSEVDTRETLTRQQNLMAIRTRQAQMGELLSMIAHQWRQPLTVVMSLIGNIQLKAKLGGLDPEYLAAKLERISQTVHFLSETIDSFRNFYAPAKNKSDEDLAALTRRALELLSPSLQKLGAQVEFHPPEVPLKVRVFTGELVQVALELITNAREALLSGVGGPPILRLTVFRDGDFAILKVQNNGGEIPSDVLPHIYDPYYTTKEGTAGTGLGLYMAKLIVETHHNGTLTASSSDGWTSFTCSLPLEGE